MLQIKGGLQIATDNYYIEHMQDGCDELHFELPLSDPAYFALNEEDRVLETTEHQTYVVKTISGGKSSAKIGCQLDLRDWKADIKIDYSKTRSAFNHINGFMPDSWTLTELPAAHSDMKTVEMRGPTPLDLALQVQKSFACAVRFDVSQKAATLLWYEDLTPSNAYAVDTVNLRRAPEFKGKSTDMYTRLFPIGKDGLRITDVNNGCDFVENLTYTTDVICKVWQDSRYEDAAELMAAARKKVDEASQPVRSWKLDLIDLYRLNEEKWPDMGVPLFTILRLVDQNKGFSANVQVVQDKIYPYYPEKNEITVATNARSIQRTLRNIYKDLYDPNSEFFQKLFAGGIT